MGRVGGVLPKVDRRYRSRVEDADKTGLERWEKIEARWQGSAASKAGARIREGMASVGKKG